MKKRVIFLLIFTIPCLLTIGTFSVGKHFLINAEVETNEFDSRTKYGDELSISRNDNVNSSLAIRNIQSEKQMEKSSVEGTDSSCASVTSNVAPIDEASVVWHDTKDEFTADAYVLSGVYFKYGSLERLISDQDDPNYYAVSISIMTSREIADKYIDEFVYDGLTYSKYKEHYFNTEIVKTYESEFEWWKNEVYPTLPDDQLKEKESEESCFKLAWWTKKHSVEEQEEYEKVFEKYVDFLKASNKFICEKHDYLNKEIAKEQIERIKNLGIYVAEERESGLTVYIKTKQLKCLTAPEGVGFNISWARQKANDSLAD